MLHVKPSAPVVALREVKADELSADAIAYLATRGISEETARECGVVSGTQFFRRAKSERRAVGYAYQTDGRTYAVKWRCLDGKDFTQTGSAQTLYLGDRIPQGGPLIITEGEADALSFWQAGAKIAGSIPSGALQAGAQDDAARLHWLANNEALIRKATAVYLAVDADGPGQTTANELARRIGKAKCWKVVYPGTCKDANDVLMAHGPDAVRALMENATPWPIEGLATPSDFEEKIIDLYRRGLPRGLSTMWPSVDPLFTLNPGNLVIVTGIPGHGKSSWLDALLIGAMKDHDWRVGYASFENPHDIHASKLIALYNDKPFGEGPTPRMTMQEAKDGLRFIDEHVVYLTHDGVSPTTASLIDRFESAVLRKGIKACVVDPFNFLKLGQRKDGGGVDTEAINEMLSDFKLFAQRAEVVFFLVAHPAKPPGGQSDFIPNGYSISGSAHFYNRADFGLTLHRGKEGNALHVWKCRFAHMGGVGSVPLAYDHATGGFVEPGEKNAEDPFDFAGFDEQAPY